MPADEVAETVEVELIVGAPAGLYADLGAQELARASMSVAAMAALGMVVREPSSWRIFANSSGETRSSASRTRIQRLFPICWMRSLL